MFRYDCASGNNTSFNQSVLINKQRSYDPTEADVGTTRRTTWLYWREYAAGLVADGILLTYCIVYLHQVTLLCYKYFIKLFVTQNILIPGTLVNRIVDTGTSPARLIFPGGRILVNLHTLMMVSSTDYDLSYTIIKSHGLTSIF